MHHRRVRANNVISNLLQATVVENAFQFSRGMCDIQYRPVAIHRYVRRCEDAML